jgi:hypothetical protein
MFGPGEYRPDPSTGITAPADLPQPEIVPYSRNDIRQPCPRCGHSAYRDKQAQRTLHDLGNLDVWCPRDLLVTYSQHYCTTCRKYFSADLSDLAPPGSQYTHRVIALAVRVVVEDGLPYRPASWHLWRDHRVVRALCHDPKLGRGWGEKRHRRAWTPSSWTGPWRIFRGMSLPMNSMTVPSVFFPPSLIAATSDSSMRSWITIPPTMISGPFWGVCTRP